MSLDSFFDTLDTETKFTNHLSDIIPTENIVELRYITETIEFINTLTLLDNNSNSENKSNLIERLYICNSYYKKFG